MIKTEHFDKIEVDSAADLRKWLMKNHSQTESVWLVTFKKLVLDKYISTAQVLDELLCFGWIDGIRLKLDEKRTMQLIGPRRKQHWAKTYKERAEKLIQERRMQPAGLNSIEQSKQSGLWNFMDDVDALIVPKDLKGALKKCPAAKSFFENLAPSAKRFTLRWIKLAKTQKTRDKRIQTTVTRSKQGEKVPGL